MLVFDRVEKVENNIAYIVDSNKLMMLSKREQSECFAKKFVEKLIEDYPEQRENLQDVLLLINCLISDCDKNVNHLLKLYGMDRVLLQIQNIIKNDDEPAKSMKILSKYEIDWNTIIKRFLCDNENLYEYLEENDFLNDYINLLTDKCIINQDELNKKIISNRSTNWVASVNYYKDIVNQINKENLDKLIIPYTSLSVNEFEDMFVKGK